MKNRRKGSVKKHLGRVTVYTICIISMWACYKDPSLAPVIVPSLVGLAIGLLAIKKYFIGQKPEE